MYATTTISGSIEAWVSPPDTVSLSDAGTELAVTSIIAAASGGTNAGALQVSDNAGGSWSSSPASFGGKNRNTSYSFLGRRVLNSINSATASNSFTPPYLATTAAGAVTTPVTSLAYDASGSVTLGVNSIPANHAYYINGTINGTSITVSGTPGTYNYQLTVARTAAGGGTGSATVTRNTVSITREAGEPEDSAPVVSGVSDDSHASPNVTATVNLSSNGSGGTLEYNNGSGWQAGSTFSQARNTTVSYSARRNSGLNLVSNSVSYAVGYLTGDTDVSASNDTIDSEASSASTTISNGTAGETYAVRVDNGSVNLGTRTGNGAISFTGSLPSSGSSTYEIFVLRPGSTGGDGSTYTATNDTFTVTRSGIVYGLKVFNEDGSTEIFGHSVRGAHFIATGTVTLANGATLVVDAEGMTAANTSNVLIGFNDLYFGTIDRDTDDEVTFGNSHGSEIIFTYHILRL